MRFRAKFQTIGLIGFPLPCLYALFWLRERHSYFPHPFLYGLCTIFLTIAALYWFFSTNFMYWELDKSCIRHRWFWKKKEIALQNVTRVGYMNYKRPSSCGLEIDYILPGPMIERRNMLVDPLDREQFITALRQFAPQAIFDV